MGNKPFAFAKTKTAALITAVLLLAVLSAVGCSRNEDDSDKTETQQETAVSAAVGSSNNEDGSDGTVTPQASAVTDSASLILNPEKLTITVTATTADGSAVTVEGCTETTLANDMETTLHAQSTAVILKGKITELYCRNNQLTALNVQGLSTLQGLDCSVNQLTSLNVQGCSALQGLHCYRNQQTRSVGESFLPKNTDGSKGTPPLEKKKPCYKGGAAPLITRLIGVMLKLTAQIAPLASTSSFVRLTPAKTSHY